MSLSNIKQRNIRHFLFNQCIKKFPPVNYFGLLFWIWSFGFPVLLFSLDIKYLKDATHFTAFIDRTAPMYLCELIDQQTSSTNTRTRLANDAFLLKLPPPSRNCSDTFFERSFTYGAPYEWNKLDERVRRLSNLNMFKSEIKTVLFLRYFNS